MTTILARMIRAGFCLSALLWAPVTFAQATDAASGRPPGAVITKLSPPLWPPIARAARVSGKVELIVTISPDGTALSSAVTSGPQMLRQAAIDSAKQSHFVCIECKDAAKQFGMAYEFHLDGDTSCAELPPKPTPQPVVSYPQITQLRSTVIIVDQAVLLCDPSADRRRSLRCLYLWKCS